MPPLPAPLRPFIYAIGGLLFGFLFLGEFGLSRSVAAQIGLLCLAFAGAIGAARRWRSVELWPVFVAAALIMPLGIDARVAGLPRCDSVRAGIACFEGTRDVVTPFAIEVVTFATATIGVTLLIAREMRALTATQPR